MNTFYIMSFSTGVLVRWPNTATLYSFESAYLSVEFSVLLWLCPTETPPMESKLHTFFFFCIMCAYIHLFKKHLLSSFWQSPELIAEVGGLKEIIVMF